MLGSVNYKGLYTCSGSRHIQVGINVIQVAATIFVIPETPQICISFLQYFLLIQSMPSRPCRGTQKSEKSNIFCFCSLATWQLQTRKGSHYKQAGSTDVNNTKFLAHRTITLQGAGANSDEQIWMRDRAWKTGLYRYIYKGIHNNTGRSSNFHIDVHDIESDNISHWTNQPVIFDNQTGLITLFRTAQTRIPRIDVKVTFLPSCLPPCHSKLPLCTHR